MRRLALLLSVFALALAGCGGGEETSPTAETQDTAPVATEPEGGEGGEEAKGDPANGKKIYAEAGCGSCHVLEDAGSSGTVGPNLDESDVSFDEAAEQIADGGGGMPAFKDKLSGSEIDDVAAYVVNKGAG